MSRKSNFGYFPDYGDTWMERINNVQGDPGDGEVLVYDATSQTWKPQIIGASRGDIIDNAIVRYSGTDGTIAAGGLILTDTGIIQNLADPVDDTDAANKKYVDDTAVKPASKPVTDNALTAYDQTSGLLIKESGLTVDATGVLSGVNDPVQPTDAVNLRTLGTKAEFQEPVVVATTTALIAPDPLDPLSGLQIVDGYTLQAGDRVLVKDGAGFPPADTTRNGIYIADSGNWARAADAQASASGKAYTVSGGSENKAKVFYVSTLGASFGDAIAFTEFYRAVQGPASSTANALPKFSDTSGHEVVASGVAVDGSNNVTGAGALDMDGAITGAKSLSMNGSTSGTLVLQPAAATSNFTLVLPSDNGSFTNYLENDGSGNLSFTRRHFFNANFGPNSTEGSNNGYESGSLWVRSDTNQAYMCTSSAPTTGVWKEISPERLNNFSATSAPTTAQNLSQGYDEGSIWCNVSSRDVYICNYSTNSTAEWALLTAGSVLNNFSAGATPTSGNNETQGYTVGSRWIYNNQEYVAVQSNTSTATWEPTANQRFSFIINFGDIGSGSSASTVIDYQGLVSSLSKTSTSSGSSQESVVRVNFNRNLGSFYTVQLTMQAGSLATPGIDCSPPSVRLLDPNYFEIYIQRDPSLANYFGLRVHCTICLS